MEPQMNQLIATLLDCPNLSLRVLDLNGRAIKTLSQEQLRHYFNQSSQTCTQVCLNPACELRSDHLN